MSTLNRTMTAYSQMVLDQFVATLTPLNAFSRDFSSVAVQKGSTVAVPRYDAITSTTFNSTYTGTGGTVNTVTVTVNKHRINTVDLTDVQQLDTDVVWTKFARQQGKSLGKLVLQDIWSVVTSTNFGAVRVTTIAGFGKSKAAVLRKALADNGVDPSECSLVVDTELYDYLLADSNISYAMYYGGAEAIREGKIPRLLGMNVYESNCIPANGITLKGFACHPDSIAIAMRGFNSVVPDGAYEYFDTVTDPESGITITIRVLYDASTGKRHASVESLFGYSAALTLGMAMATGLPA